MKKILFGFFLFGLAMFCMPKTIHASATNSISFYTTETEVFAGYTMGSYQIPSDSNHYFKISVFIEGISSTNGFASISMTVPYDNTNFQAVSSQPNDPNGDYPVYVLGPALTGVSPHGTSNNSVGLFAFSALGTLNNDDGELFSFLLRTSSNNTPETEVNLQALLEEDKDSLVEVEDDGNGNDIPVIYDHDFVYYYILGDIDGDGYVTLDDAQNLYRIATKIANGNAHTYEEAIALLTDLDFDGMYITDHTAALRFIMEVGDVNFDGILDEDDAFDILDYYTYHLANPNYTSIIGTQFAGSYTYYDTNP